MPHLEIERKYLLDRMPSLPASAEAWQIEQGYLPEGGRVRRAVAHDGRIVCTHTIKKGAGLVREEFERAISEDEYAQFRHQTDHRRLCKTRYCVPHGNHIWEIDAFEGIDLALAEIELDDPSTVIEFPDWLKPHIVREVTDEPAFTNSNLALRLVRLNFEQST